MKRLIANLLLVVMLATFMPVLADEAENGENIVAGFSYYDETAAPEIELEFAGDKDEGYMSTYGTDIGSKLFLSVDGEKNRKLEWSDVPYLRGDREEYVPVMSAGNKNPWGESPYIKIVFSAEGYEELKFSMQLGGSGKSPSDAKLFFSTDDVNYEEIGSYRITESTVMEQAFTDVSLPTGANNKEAVYLKVQFVSPRTINGSEVGFSGSPSGRIALNDIVITGKGEGVTIFDGIEVTPRPTPTPPAELYPSSVTSERVYYNAVKLLVKLGVIDSDKPYYPSREITSADFAEMLKRANGGLDVDYTDGTITMGEAVAKTISYLGYDVVLENTTETPYSIAKSIGLLADITYSEEANLKVGDAAILIYNALNAYIVKQVGFGQVEEYAQVYENWLKHVFDVTKIEGVITDVPFYKHTHAYGRVGFTTIYGEEINAYGSDESAEALVGHRSFAFIKDAYGDAPEFVFAYKSARDVTLPIKKGDFLGVTEVREDSIVISYEYSTTLIEKAVISRNADFVYNGAVNEQLKNDCFNMAEDALKPSHIGNIELVDINDDEVYDYVFVNNHLDMYIDAIDYENFVVSNKLKYIEGTSDKITQYHEIPSITLNPDSDQYKVLFYKADGKTPASFDDIKKGSVLSVAASEMSGDYDISLVKKVIISDMVVEGEVENVLVEDGDAEFVIAGNSYRPSKSYHKTYDHGNEDEITSIKFGDVGTFYLNYDGRIVYVDKTAPSVHYGVFIRAALKKGLSDDMLVQIVLKDGSAKVFQITDKQYRLWNLSFVAGPAIIKYSTDKSGEKLIKLDASPEWQDMGEMQYSARTNRLGKYFLTEESKVFVYTSDVDVNRLDAKYYDVVPFDSFVDKTSYMTNLYDIKNNAYPAAAIIDYDFKNAAFTNEKIMFVSKVSSVLDDEGFATKKVDGYNAQGAITLICDREMNTYPLAGTVVQYRANADGEMVNYNILADSLSTEVTVNGVFDDEYYALRSNVTGMTNDILTVKNEMGEYENYKVAEDVSVHAIYTVADGEYYVQKDMFENITNGNKLFIHQSYGFVTEIFVWKNN